MKHEDKAVLDGLKSMGKEAAEIGLCAMPFAVLYDYVERLINERDEAVAALRRKENA